MQGTMNEDLSTDENLGSAGNDGELAKQFLRPPYTWRGLELRPYTAGTDLLFSQVLDRNDAPSTIFLSFIFIHVHDPEKLIELCWDKLEYRKALINWIESLGEVTSEDKIAAMELFEQIRGWARKSSVEVIPDPSLPEKKTKAKNRQPSRA
jgi:hypothetical protein